MSTLNRRTLPTVLAAMSARAIVSDTAPLHPNDGAIWFDTVAGALKVWDGSAWNIAEVSTAGIADGSVTTGKVDFTAFDIGGKNVTISGTAPTSANVGDVWFDSSSGYVMNEWNGTTWQPFQWDNGAIANGSIDINKITFTARDIGGISTTIAATAPTGAKAGDLWYDSSNGYKLNHFDGTAWSAFQYGTNAIAAGSITAALIAADTITAAQIASGAITTDELAAGAVTAEKLTVGGRGQGIFLNPSFEEAGTTTGGAAQWIAGNVGSNAASRIVDTTRATSGTGMMQMTAVGVSPGSYCYFASAAYYPVSPSTDYYVRVAYGAAAAANGMYVRLYWYKADGTATAGAGYTDLVANGAVAATATNSQVFEGITTTPPDAAFAYPWIYWLPDTVGATLYIDSYDIMPAVTGSLIVNGTITASKLQAHTITAAEIAANTITASEIAAGTIVAGIVDGTTISGAQFIAHGTAGEVLVYNGTPAAGNLILAIAPAASQDAFNNGWSDGLTLPLPSAGVATGISFKKAGTTVGANLIGSISANTSRVQIATHNAADIALVPDSTTGGEITFEFTGNAIGLKIGSGIAGKYYQEKVTASSTQSFATNSLTALTGLSSAKLRSDYGSAWNLTTGVWTCPATGPYRFAVQLNWNGWTAGSRGRIQILNNTTGNPIADIDLSQIGITGHVCVMGEDEVTFGDQIVVQALQATGSAKTLLASSFIHITRTL